jgi:beta-phosphoglucomutase
MDGVITNTVEYHFLAWKRLAEGENIPFSRQDNDQLRGLSRRDALYRILRGRSIDETTAEALMERKHAYFQEYLSQLTPHDRLPGVTAFLHEARAAGLLLGIGSASRNTRDVLKCLELLDYFDAIGDAFSVVKSKPAPDIFLWVARRLNVSPNQAVVFEDGEAGIEAALKGGFWTVGLGSANVERAHLVFPDLVNVKIAEILAQFQGAIPRPAPL